MYSADERYTTFTDDHGHFELSVSGLRRSPELRAVANGRDVHLKLWTANILNLKERSGFAARRCENGYFHPLFFPSPVAQVVHPLFFPSPVAQVVVKQTRNGDSPLNLAVRQLPLMSKTEQIADYVDVMMSSVPLIKSILWPVDCSELSVSAYESARGTLVFQEMFACLRAR